MLFTGGSKRTISGSVFLSTLFIRCLSWLSSQGQGRWCSCSSIHKWKLKKMVKFTCNELNSLENNIGVVTSFRRIQFPMTSHLKLFFWYGASDWTFSFWASFRRTLTSFCALHGRFPNPRALEQSWVLKWSLGLIWYFSCSSRHISYDVSSWPSLLKRTFFFLASNVEEKCSCCVYLQIQITLLSKF